MFAVQGTPSRELFCLIAEELEWYFDTKLQIVCVIVVLEGAMKDRHALNRAEKDHSSEV